MQLHVLFSEIAQIITGYLFMTESRTTNFVLLTIAAVFGLLLACGMLALGIFGYISASQQQALHNEGVLGTADVIDSQITGSDCYQIKYSNRIDGVDYLPTGYLNTTQAWSSCLEAADRVQARQFGTVQIIYLPTRPEVSQLAGTGDSDLTISWVLTSLCLGGGIIILAGLIIGWLLRFKYSGSDGSHKSAEQTAAEESGAATIYPLFSQYETLGKRIGVVQSQFAPTDHFEQHLTHLNATYDDIEQWIVIDHFGQTPLGEQKVSARFFSGSFAETKGQKPTIEAVASLVYDIASHADYKAASLIVKCGVLSFKVTSDLKIPLVPLLPKPLPKEEYLVLSNQTEEIAGFQVQSVIFPTDLGQRVEIIRHPRYPSSGRYPSSKVLDMVQAEAKTNMHLQLVVPRKEGRGQRFELHSSYQTVPITDLSTSAMFAIAWAIHMAQLASDTIQLSGYPGDPVLFVTDDLKVNVQLTPQAVLTRIEYTSEPGHPNKLKHNQ
ncbi:MAG: hypothetical protein ACI9EW_001107 [Cellvibrionaceae bacterium]|jgi:hypothetical protein